MDGKQKEVGISGTNYNCLNCDSFVNNFTVLIVLSRVHNFIWDIR